MSAVPDADYAALRARAEAVVPAIKALLARWQALPDDHPYRIHALFAELYLCTTRRWLAALAERRDSEYAYRVICHFFALYRLHVLERLEQFPEASAPHWQRYHRSARRQTIRSPISAHLVLISIGVRAHVHFDLGCAMLLAGEEMSRGGAGGPAPLDAHQEIFGKLSDDAFSRAALDYVLLHHARQTGWRRLVLGLYRVGLLALKPIWLTVFQRWRWMGYDKAIRDRTPAPGQRNQHSVDGGVLSEEPELRREGCSLAFMNEQTLPFQVLQNQPGDHPPRGNNVRQISPVAPVCRRPAARTRYRR